MVVIKKLPIPREYRMERVQNEYAPAEVLAVKAEAYVMEADQNIVPT